MLESGPEALRVATLLSARALGPRELAGLIVEYGSPRGRVQLTGAAAMRDPSEPDVIRVDGPLTVDVLQERDFVRVSSARPVLVYMGPDREQIQSFTVDLSGGGLLLAGPDTLQIGEQIDFRLTVSQDSPPITGRGHGRAHRLQGPARASASPRSPRATGGVWSGSSSTCSAPSAGAG